MKGKTDLGLYSGIRCFREDGAGLEKEKDGVEKYSPGLEEGRIFESYA